MPLVIFISFFLKLQLSASYPLLYPLKWLQNRRKSCWIVSQSELWKPLEITTSDSHLAGVEKQRASPWATQGVSLLLSAGSFHCTRLLPRYPFLVDSAPLLRGQCRACDKHFINICLLRDAKQPREHKPPSLQGPSAWASYHLHQTSTQCELPIKWRNGTSVPLWPGCRKTACSWEMQSPLDQSYDRSFAEQSWVNAFTPPGIRCSWQKECWEQIWERIPEAYWMAVSTKQVF